MHSLPPNRPCINKEVSYYCPKNPQQFLGIHPLVFFQRRLTDFHGKDLVIEQAFEEFQPVI
jgi:hypothetical protein